MDLSTWEITRSTAAAELETAERRRLAALNDHKDGEVVTAGDGLMFQEVSRARVRLRDLDDQEEAVRRRAELQDGRPSDCLCLGTGGVGRLLAVMSDGLTIFEDYCTACPEGIALREMSAWASVGIEEEDRQEQERAERERQIAREREMLTRAGIDQRYAGCTFESLRALLVERQAMRPDLDRALSKIEHGYASGPLRGDWIWGEPGHGKTSLQTAMARMLIAQGRSCVVMHYGDLLEKMRLAYGRKDGSGDELMERLRNVPVFFLDDFMMVQASKHEIGRVTTLLVARHAAGRRLLTGFTSNYSIREASLRLTGDDGGYDAKRIEGRLREMCDELPWKTVDLRTGLREHVS
jgi:DNA replication protein DnaC